MNRMTVRKMSVERRVSTIWQAAGGTACRRLSTRWSSSASWPARGIRSIRWRRPSRNWASSYLGQTEHLHDDWTLVREYPLSKQPAGHVPCLESRPTGEEYVIAAKGAPEAIADLCHLDEAQRRELSRSRRGHGRRGPAGAGRGQGPVQTAPPCPRSSTTFDFEFLGLVGLADPVRPAVPAAIKRMLTRPGSGS